VSQYQKGKTNPDFTEARDSEWQWHWLGHMQVCILLQTDNHASTPQFLQAGCPSCRPTNSVKALKAIGKKTKSKKTDKLRSIGKQSGIICGVSLEEEKEGYGGKDLQRWKVLRLE